MEYNEKKYIVLPDQEESGQMEFDMEQMEEESLKQPVQDEYEQMQFQVNSFYQEVSREIAPKQLDDTNTLGNNNPPFPNGNDNHSVINQKRYDAAQKFYQKAFEDSYQDGYYQGYQECYEKVYEQAYQKAYQQAYQQAAGQVQPEVSNQAVILDEAVEIPKLKNNVLVNEEVDFEAQGDEKVTQDNNNVPETSVPETSVPETSVPETCISEVQDEAEIQDVMGIPSEEIHPERQNLQEIAREEYRDDVRLYAGKWSTSYVRKFSKMNDTKQFLNWNMPAFLFGPLWYAYRKMPLAAIALLVAMVLALSADNGLILVGIIMVLSGALSDKIYKTHMDKLLDTKAIMGDEAQVRHLRLRGGVSIIYPMTLLVLAAGAGVYITEVLIYKSDFLRGIYDNIVNLYYQYL